MGNRNKKKYWQTSYLWQINYQNTCYNALFAYMLFAAKPCFRISALSDSLYSHNSMLLLMKFYREKIILLKKFRFLDSLELFQSFGKPACDACVIWKACLWCLWHLESLLVMLGTFGKPACDAWDIWKACLPLGSLWCPGVPCNVAWSRDGSVSLITGYASGLEKDIQRFWKV